MMTVREFITVLDAFAREHGDLPLYAYDDWAEFAVTSVERRFDDGLAFALIETGPLPRFEEKYWKS